MIYFSLSQENFLISHNFSKKTAILLVPMLVNFVQKITLLDELAYI